MARIGTISVRSRQDAHSEEILLLRFNGQRWQIWIDTVNIKNAQLDQEQSVFTVGW